jgi:hypothetical protein
MLRPTSILAAVSLFGALAAPAGFAGSANNPTPAHDAFYKVPKNIAKYRDGQVIASRTITARSWGIRLRAKAWQLKYRTEDYRGRPTATITTVLVPTAAWTGPGPRPLLSYQTAEDGVSRSCAPSYAYRSGLNDAATGSYDETMLMAMGLAQGWAVAAPDYEGPRSEFLVAGTEGREVLDGLRAAREFAPAHVSSKAKLGLWGYSGGAFASDAAAQLQPSYAPDVRLRAVALGGLPASIPATIKAFDGTIAAGAIPMAINGFLRAYPHLHLRRYLNASGRRKVKTEAHDCIYRAASRYPFLRVKQIEARPNALEVRPVARMLRRNSPLYRQGIPQGPVYEYHAIGDELAPIAPARLLLQRYCRQGAQVDHIESPLGEHNSEVITGAQGALRWLGNQFSGKRSPDTCQSLLARGR